jgi:hypothetical protein
MNLRSASNAVLVAIAMSAAGCGISKVVTAPVHYLFGPPEPATTHNNVSDVSHPGRPVPVPSPTPRAASRKSAQRPSTAAAKPSPAKKSASAATSSSQFPTAKPVPGKPGLVFNPFKPNGGYIDVSGYASGSKVKDPDTQKIFVVP